MRWAKHVACVYERSGACAVTVGKTLGKRQVERFVCRWWTILKWILKNRLEKHGGFQSGSWEGKVVGFCEHGNELSGSHKLRGSS